jgi:hypothetical protein
MFAFFPGKMKACSGKCTEKWEPRPDLPDISRLLDGRCPRCGTGKPLDPSEIYYKNIHGPYNTGLPDYYVLIIGGGNRKWDCFVGTSSVTASVATK